MDRLLRWALQQLIRSGNVRVTTAGGTTFNLGDGIGKPVALRFTTRAAERGVLLHPELRFGEAYMDGELVVEQGSVADVLAVVLGQRAAPLWRPVRLPGRFLSRRL